MVIGSLHNIRDHDDFYHIGEHNPTEQEISNALHAYFAESLEMVAWGKFDTLAHITYPLRYMCKAGETPSYKPYQDELDAVLKALIKSDIAMEFNTSRICARMRRSCPTAKSIRAIRSLAVSLSPSARMHTARRTLQAA